MFTKEQLRDLSNELMEMTRRFGPTKDGVACWNAVDAITFLERELFELENKEVLDVVRARIAKSKAEIE